MNPESILTEAHRLNVHFEMNIKNKLNQEWLCRLFIKMLISDVKGGLGFVVIRLQYGFTMLGRLAKGSIYSHSY